MNFLPERTIQYVTQQAGEMSPNDDMKTREFTDPSFISSLTDKIHISGGDFHAVNNNRNGYDSFSKRLPNYEQSYMINASSMYAPPGQLTPHGNEIDSWNQKVEGGWNSPSSSSDGWNTMTSSDSWNPLSFEQKPRKNSVVGKLLINSDSNLRHSTEDLLSLVNQSHLNESVNEIGNESCILKECDTSSSSLNEPFTDFVGGSSSSSSIMTSPSGHLGHHTISRLDALADPTVDPIAETTTLSSLREQSSSLDRDISKPSTFSSQSSTSSMVSNESTDAVGSKSTCRYYSLGICKKGKKCNFLHTVDHSLDVSTNMPVNKTPSRKNSRHMSIPMKYSKMTIDDCKNRIYTMCKDQNGCRFLQKVLEEDETGRSCDIIYEEVLPHIAELMLDPFGNYLCQKLIEKCTVDQRISLIRDVSSHLVKISRNIHGTRAVQKTIELITHPQEIKYVREALKGNVVSLIQDLNGNHVIQKCINKLEPNDNQFIYDAVARHCVQVSTHRHGCCVMQRCIDHASSQQKIMLIEEIINNALVLVQDAFGNYVVQYILDFNSDEVCQKVAEKLIVSLYALSLQKFSSNVIEKCLKVGNEKTVKMITRELINYKFNDQNRIKGGHEDPLIPLLQHPYGNYVIQTALHVASTKAVEEWEIIADRIRSNMHNLKKTPYVKKIQSLIKHGKERSRVNEVKM